MGEAYERWLIAKSNVFSPSAAAIVKLVEHLRAENWIGPPSAGGYAVTTVENRFGDDLAAKRAASTTKLPAELTPDWLDAPDREELRLVWPIEIDGPSPVAYPLSRAPEGRISYTLELHRAPDYVYPISTTIGALVTTCRCGEDLAFEWDDEELVPAFGTSSSGIFAECEDCSQTFDPMKASAILTNPFDGTREEVRGGAAYRFALKVDCGRAFVRDAKLAFAPELVALLEKEFGRSFHEVGRLT